MPTLVGLPSKRYEKLEVTVLSGFMRWMLQASNTGILTELMDLFRDTEAGDV